MSRLAQFFKGTDSHFGIFEPRDHIIAVYEDFSGAKQAEKKLSYDGLGEEQVIAVPGEDVVQFAEEHVIKHGLWGAMMQQISNLLATEEVFAERDLEMARRGAAFLAVHCPTETAKNAAWRTLQPTQPWVARYYSIGGVEHLQNETERKVEPEKPLPPVPDVVKHTDS